jgi:hypothetical protein
MGRSFEQDPKDSAAEIARQVGEISTGLLSTQRIHDSVLPVIADPKNRSKKQNQSSLFHSMTQSTVK